MFNSNNFDPTNLYWAPTIMPPGERRMPLVRALINQNHSKLLFLRQEGTAEKPSRESWLGIYSKEPVPI